MQINKEELLKALVIVKPGLANKEIIEQATSFAFIENRIVTYNDEISISHPITGLSLTGAVKADEFYNLLGKIKADVVDIEVAESEIILKVAKAKAGLTLHHEILLPLDNIDKQTEWRPLCESFVSDLDFAMQSCGNDMSKAMLTCVHIRKDGILESSDGYRISRIKSAPIKIKSNILLRSKSASIVISIKPTHINLTNGWVHFKNTQDTILSCRIDTDTFVTLDSHLQVEGTEIKLPQSLHEILDCASIFSKRDHIYDESVVVIIENRKMKVKGQSDSGWYEEEANIRYDGPAITFSITPGFLKNITNKTQSCVLNDQKIKFIGENWEYLAMLKARAKQA